MHCGLVVLSVLSSLLDGMRNLSATLILLLHHMKTIEMKIIGSLAILASIAKFNVRQHYL